MYSNEKNSGDLANSERIRKMVSIINQFDLKEKNILDIGCHDGTLLSMIENGNNAFFGLDASDWWIERCREKNIAVQQYFFDDEKKLPYEESFFDLVIAGEIIEHIYDTDFFLEEIRRVLKPKGKLIISTPNIASLGRRFFLLAGINPLIEISPNEAGSVGHIRYFTFDSLNRLIRKHRFRIISQNSDCVNFSKNGFLKSAFLANIFSYFGASIIILAEKK